MKTYTIQYINDHYEQIGILLAILIIRKSIPIIKSWSVKDTILIYIMGLMVWKYIGKVVTCQVVQKFFPNSSFANRLNNDDKEEEEENEDEIKNGKNQTQPSAGQQQSSFTSMKQLPMLPILSLLLLLGLTYLIPHNLLFFLLPMLLRVMSGELDPDSTLGKILLPLLGGRVGRSGEDMVTRLAYVPPIEQHYTFEQLNERYWRDYGAYRKAFGVNSMIGGSSGLKEEGCTTTATTSSSGGGMGALTSLLINSRSGSTKLSSSTQSTTTSSPHYPTKMNNGTVIILDMTKLNQQATQMENVRDQISFLIQLVDSLKEDEDVKSMAGTLADALHAAKTQKTNVTSIANATLLASNETISDAPNESNVTHTSSSSASSSPPPSSSPIVEVIILLESPGGGVSEYGLASSHLQRLRSNPNIKLTICVDTIAASGGYMMACMATPGQLYCAPFAMIGSIGVIGQSLNIQKTLESYGVKPYVFRGGKMKNPVGMVGDVTKDGISSMQEMIDRIHTAFRDHVGTNRETAFTQSLLAKDGIPLPTENYFQLGSSGADLMSHVMDQVASGDVYLGVQAIKLGLVDRLITSDEYISERIRQGARVLKLIDYHRTGLSDLFSAPSPRHRMGSSMSAVRVMKKVMYRMLSSLLTWADDGSSSVPAFAAAAEGIAGDLQIR